MANDTLSLLPNPQHLVDLGGPATLSDNRLIILDSSDPHRLRFTAGQLQQALQQHAKVNWQIVTGNTAPSEQGGLTPIIPGDYAK
jgi:hypothetical protein